MKKLTGGLVLATAALASAALWPQRVVGLLRLLFPNVLWKADTSEGVVALTFDDGPDPIFTPQVLNILRDFNIKATFFLVGERARQHSAIIESIKTSGHAIANHTDSWRRTLALNATEFEQDLLRAERSLGLTDPKFFRPAGGMLTPRQRLILEEYDYTIVLGSAYAFDPYRPSPRIIKWAIGRGISPGAIIVLHDSGGDRSNTVAALPAIIRSAQRRGFSFVTLPQLLKGAKFRRVA
jgi:peptidoglycan/xylan/chitin deacetylase (PgdA/CDA1 family)